MNNAEIVSVCEKLAEQFSSNRVASFVANTKQCLTAIDTVNVAFLGSSLPKINRLLEMVLETEIFSNLEIHFVDKDCRVRLQCDPDRNSFQKENRFYMTDSFEEVTGEQVKQMLEDNSSAEEIRLTVSIPDSRLDKLDIDIFTGFKNFSDSSCSEALLREDFVFFATDARVALPDIERKVLLKSVIPLFGQDRLALVLLEADKL